MMSDVEYVANAGNHKFYEVMDMVLEDIVLLSSVQLLSDVTELMQEQISIEKSIKLEVLAHSLAKAINALEDSE